MQRMAISSSSATPLFFKNQRPASSDELAAIPWLAVLPTEWRIKAQANIRVTVAKQGDYICRVGKPVSHWFGVIEGLIKMSSDSEDGKTTTFIGVPSGGWFGEGTVLKREPYRYNIQPLRETLVAGITAEMFMELLDHSISFNRFVMGQLNERVSQFISGLEADRMRDPDRRVAHTLVNLMNPRLYPRLGNSVKITQQELADLAGLSRQRVNVALQHLVSQNKIALEYGGLRVMDMKGLML
jgi:CRP-like cAMP-binding protein